MSAFREELVELIEAYAAAQVSGNARLKILMVEELKKWLAEHDIVGPVDVPEEVKAAVGKSKT